LQFGWSTIRALRSQRFKVIDTARPELYDLQHDPDERQNLFNSRRDVAEPMLQRLRRDESLAGDRRRPEPRAIDLELQRHLGALGYVSVRRRALPLVAHHGHAPDPKDLVAEFNRLTTRGLQRSVDLSDSVLAASEVLR
jgi:hypothetical protein